MVSSYQKAVARQINQVTVAKTEEQENYESFIQIIIPILLSSDI